MFGERVLRDFKIWHDVVLEHGTDHLGRIGRNPLIDGVETLSEVPLDLQRVSVTVIVIINTI